MKIFSNGILRVAPMHNMVHNMQNTAQYNLVARRRRNNDPTVHQSCCVRNPIIIDKLDVSLFIYLLYENLYVELENFFLYINQVVRRCTLYIPVFTLYSLLQSTRDVVQFLLNDSAQALYILYDLIPQLYVGLCPGPRY